MKFTLTLQDMDGNMIEITGDVRRTSGAPASIVKLLWDTEHRINERGDIRAHVNLEEDAPCSTPPNN